jgi:hypothetical protein
MTRAAGARGGWEPSPGRYALLAVIWIAAIGLVVWLAGDRPPAGPPGWDDTARLYAPIAVAFVLTLLILVPPRAHTGIGPVRAVGAILLGCVWVSWLPLAVVAAKAGYARVALLPVCRAHGAERGLVSRGVRFQLPNAQWWEPNVRPEATCLYDDPPRVTAAEVPMERLVGAGRAFALVVAGGVAVVAGGLGAWALVTAGVAWWLWRRWRGRCVAPG